MTVGLAFLLLCSAAFVAFGTAAATITDGPQGPPIELRPILPPVATVFVMIVVVTTISQWVGHDRDWGVALNRISYSVLIGSVVGLLGAVALASNAGWSRRIARIAGTVAVHPGRAWIGASVAVVAFVAGALSRS